MSFSMAADLGSVDEFSGLLVVPASELDIERCRELFDVSLRLRPLEGNGWHVLVLEELDGVGSKQVERYLKVKLEHDRAFDLKQAARLVAASGCGQSRRVHGHRRVFQALSVGSCCAGE